MSENDILVVSETSRDAKAAFIQFKDIFFDRPWVKRMFTHPVPMFELANGAEIIFVSKAELPKKRVGFRGWVCTDDMINQVVRQKYGH